MTGVQTCALPIYRLYLAIRVYPKKENETEQRQQPYYFVMKQPYAKVPRFIELPAHEKDHYLMFTEDIIKANLNLIFPGYDVDSSYCIKISRDADILIDDTASSADLVAQLKKKVKKRKIGDVCRFEIGRASVGKECLRLCRSRWSPYH